MKNAIQKAAENKAVAPKKQPTTIKEYVESMQGEIARALPSVMTPERFTRITLSALSTNPKLADCDPKSFLGAMMTAAQLGVEPNTPLGQAYLIPYGKQCQFQLGYKGLLDLAYRSGEVSIIQAQTVYKNDEFEFEYGLEPRLKHIPAKSDRGEPVFFYAMFKMKDGGYGFEVDSIDNIRAFAKKKSKTYGSGPWQTDFEEMAKKTVLKRVLKYAPLKSDFVREIAQDETVKTQIDADMTFVPDESVIEADFEEIAVDEETGEILSKGVIEQ